MVKPIYSGMIFHGKQYMEFAGKSTDVKPLGDYLTGSRFTEVDTGDIYAYDEESGGSWNKIASLLG